MFKVIQEHKLYTFAKIAYWELLVSIPNPDRLPGVNFTCHLLVSKDLIQGSLRRKQEVAEIETEGDP